VHEESCERGEIESAAPKSRRERGQRANEWAEGVRRSVGKRALGLDVQQAYDGAAVQ
jgi:hypothetical protein